MQTTDTITTYDAHAAWRCQLPATPYQRGFEDAVYGRIYANPYRVASDQWRQYEAGSQDARAQGRKERTQ